MMAANITPAFASLSLEAQLDIVRNVDVFGKRVKAINEAEASAKAEREKLTKAKDLDQALKNAKQSAESALVALSDARSEAAHIVNQATAKAAEIVGGAKSQAAQISQAANDSISETLKQIEEKKTELTGLDSEAKSLSQHIGTMTEQLNGLTTTVASLEAQKTKLLEVITDKQRKLKALMAE